MMVDIVTARYAVVLHSSGATGGYVVRTVTDGSLAHPYSVDDALSLHSTEAAARREADRRNEPLFGPREPASPALLNDHQVRDAMARMDAFIARGERS